MNPGKKKNPLSSDKSLAIPKGKGTGYVLDEKGNEKRGGKTLLPASQKQDIAQIKPKKSKTLTSNEFTACFPTDYWEIIIVVKCAGSGLNAFKMCNSTS